MFEWRLREQDADVFSQELESFVPDRIYDVHAHLYRTKFWDTPPPCEAAGPPDITLEVYREHMQWIFPKREIHGMHFPLAFVDDPSPGNNWVSQQIKEDPQARGQFLVKPSDDPEWVRQEMKRLGLRGLKVWYEYGKAQNPWETEIPDYLPEQIMRIAGQEGWSITLHMVRSHGVSDPTNQHWIKYYCQKFPEAQLILDHAARGFNPYHVLNGLGALSGLDNLWIDTSVVCNPLAIEAAIRFVGPERLLYGSDFCISHYRATNFAVADTFLWLYEDSPVWKLPEHTTEVTPLLVGLENLRAIKAAFWSCGLTDSQVEDFFWGNAARMLGI